MLSLHKIRSREIIKKRVFFIVGIIIFGFALYSNSLQAEFCADDFMFIIENPSVKNLGNIVGIWNSFNTRFLGGLSFAFNYWIGKFDVFSYHVFNISIHIFNAILVYFLILNIFKTPSVRETPLRKYHGEIALFACLIFLSHPIQTQAAVHISQRFSSMATFFYLFTIIFYIKGRLETNSFYSRLSFFSMIMAMFCKELAVTLPFMLVVCEFFFWGSWRKQKKERLLHLFPFLLGIAIIPLTLLANHPDSVLYLKGQVLNQPFSWDYFATEVNVLRTCLRLLFVPVNQIYWYDYPLAKGFGELHTVISYYFLVGLIFFAFYIYRTSKLISFSIIWFFITISVQLGHVCFVQEKVFFEHWLYLPMVGFSLLLPVFFFGFFKNRKRIIVFLSILIAVYSILTYQRNKVWHTRVSLWKDHIKKTPNSAEAYFALGTAYQREGFYSNALPLFEKAIELDPLNQSFYLNAGVAYKKMGDFTRAVMYYNKALSIPGPNRKDDTVYANLGNVFYEQRNYGIAIENFKKAIMLNPKDAGHYFLLARAYRQKGEDAKAEDSLRKALEIDPRHLASQNQLGTLYMEGGQYQKAVILFESILKSFPHLPSLHAVLGQCYSGLGEDSKAKVYFDQAIKLYREQGVEGIRAEDLKELEGEGP